MTFGEIWTFLLVKVVIPKHFWQFWVKRNRERVVMIFRKYQCLRANRGFLLLSLLVIEAS